MTRANPACQRISSHVTIPIWLECARRLTISCVDGGIARAYVFIYLFVCLVS